MPNPTLLSLADDLEAGRTSARKLVEECIARIAAPDGEGQRTFIHVDRDAALAAADAMDHLRKAHAAPSRFAGIPVSIKDLFDISGQVTRAGSRVLEDSAAAEKDAPVVARLRRAGFVVIGRTNMTEFAYSGIGINPHYGTPKSAWQRKSATSPAALPRAPRSRSPTAWPMARSAPTPAAPAAFLPLTTDRRLQADAKPHPARWRRAVVVHARQLRAAGQFRAMLRDPRCRAGR